MSNDEEFVNRFIAHVPMSNYFINKYKMRGGKYLGWSSEDYV